MLSEPGLVNIFEFLRATGRGEESPALTAELASGMSAETISAAGLAGTSSRAVQAVELFVTLYGAEAGNLALKMKATRGVLIGGGIAPKLITKLREPRFLAAFLDKGRMSPLLKHISIRVILNDQCALLGAALYAALEAGLSRIPLSPSLRTRDNWHSRTSHRNSTVTNSATAPADDATP